LPNPKYRKDRQKRREGECGCETSGISAEHDYKSNFGGDCAGVFKVILLSVKMGCDTTPVVFLDRYKM
jgi:hypothetical protein